MKAINFSKLAVAMCLPLVMATQAGAQDTNKLYINKSANADNFVLLDGALSATVTHTADGLELEIPGVTVSLDCSNSSGASADPAETCTVTLGGAISDADGDGIPDDQDNCVADANADQADNDTDGYGNVCDSTPNGEVQPPPPADTDGDGEPDTSDNCKLIANADQKDSDNDGQGDACDSTPNGNTGSGDGASSDKCGSGYGGGLYTIKCQSKDWGPAGNTSNGGTEIVTIGIKELLAFPLQTVDGVKGGYISMSPDQTTAPPLNGGSPRVYISTEPGNRVMARENGSCASGYQFPNIRWSVGGGGCTLEAGKTYWLNMVTCADSRYCTGKYAVPSSEPYSSKIQTGWE